MTKLIVIDNRIDLINADYICSSYCSVQFALTCIPIRRQEEKSGERKLLLEDVVGAAPGVKDMGAVGWGAAPATGIHDRDGRGGRYKNLLITQIV